MDSSDAPEHTIRHTAIVPAVNVYNFATCPIEHLVDEGEGMKIRELFRKPVFWIAVCLMVCSGASELSMSQWASAYAEAALGLSKTIRNTAIQNTGLRNSSLIFMPSPSSTRCSMGQVAKL